MIRDKWFVIHYYPLLRLDELKKLLWEKRLPYYRKADMCVNTTNRAVEQNC
jgi:hypothetical protein